MDRRGALRFVIGLTLAMVAFNAAFYLWIAPSRTFEHYLGANARVSASLLRAFGEETAVATGTLLASSRFSLEVKHGCDALQPIAFFVFAMLASPVAVAQHARLAPIVLGTLALLVLNLVRITSLYYVGIYYPSLFEPLHIDVWQAVFIFLPLAFWLAWALRARRGANVTVGAE